MEKCILCKMKTCYVIHNYEHLQDLDTDGEDVYLCEPCFDKYGYGRIRKEVKKHL